MTRHFHILCFVLLVSFSFSQVTLVKGPYLQMGTPNSMTLKWETNIAVDSYVKYGTNPSALTSFAGNGFTVTSHEIVLGGLSPYTKYYYSIGTTTSTIQGDTNNYFVTSPLSGKGGKYRFWVTGDCGSGLPEQLKTKSAYLYFNKNRVTNGWLLLGDNAYFSGADAEYNVNFFAPYMPDIMKKAVLWPAPGNHEYANGVSTTTNVPYFSIFSVPTNAEAGGISSGTESFYSYDYGNIHFVSIDSFGAINGKKLNDTTGAQVTWLKQDLAANNKMWTVAYWHHPPYTMGTHNSDLELDLDSIRKYTMRVMERYKVDLVLCGHSHTYERSKLMKGHFGNEASFNAATHHLDTSSALYNGSLNSCPYIKDSVFKNQGTVYIVAGSAGKIGATQSNFPHNAMYYSNNSICGSLILDFDNNRLDTKWLGADSLLHDNFTILKSVNKVKTYTVTATQNFTLTASWPGKYIWGGRPDTTRSTVIHPSADSVYWVKDVYNCVADTFKIFTVPDVGLNELDNELGFKVYPNPTENNITVSFQLLVPEKNAALFVLDVYGRSIPVFNSHSLDAGKNSINLNCAELSMANGVYFLTLKLNNRAVFKKFVLQR